VHRKDRVKCVVRCFNIGLMIEKKKVIKEGRGEKKEESDFLY